MKTKLFNILSKFIFWFQFRIDTTRFIFDKPEFDYQPIPWLSINEAKIRGEATVERWKSMKNLIPQESFSFKDIGCCVGYFCISAAEQLNMFTFGVDNNERFLRIAKYATPSNLREKCNFIQMTVDEKNSAVLPNTDVTLCLSIWHHWVANLGLERATLILNNLWNSTNKVMFFESGEEEIKEEFNMPFVGKASDWLFLYLKNNLKNCRVEKVGIFDAGNYEHYKLKNIKRTVFVLLKD